MGMFEKKDVTLAVEGMTCSHCVQAVEGALAGQDGVKKVKVDLEQGTAWVRGATDIDKAALVNAVKDAGYGARVTG